MKDIHSRMFSAFTLSLAAVLITIFGTVYTENQNETSQSETDNDFADSGAAVARNLTASFSVSDTGVDDKISNSDAEKLSSNVSITDRISENQDFPPSIQKHEKAVEFNTAKNITVEPKMLGDFRPSTQLGTFYEHNKFPVKPALPEPKMIKNYATITAEDKEYYVKGEVLPLETERSRNLNSFEPRLSTFGNSDFPNPGRPQDGLSREKGGISNNNGPPWAGMQSVSQANRKNENGESPWAQRVRFPHNPSTNPYPFANTGTDQNVNCCHGQPEQNPPYPISNYNTIGQLPPPQNNEYLPPSGSTNGYPLSAGPPDTSNNYNNINVNKLGYLPPSPNYGFTGGGNAEVKNRYTPPNYGSSGNEQFNFNKLVEVPRTFYSGAKYPPHHKTYETASYNLMEKPASESQHKTYDGGLSSNPWKKVLKLLATFIPIGLLIGALTPTVITVTSVNDTTDTSMASRYRSNDDSKKEVTNHILSSLDYFDQLNENGCEYRVFCELLVSASHMPNSRQHVDNLLDNFAKEEADYKSRAEDLKKVFAAVRSHDCNSIPCEYIKNPT